MELKLVRGGKTAHLDLLIVPYGIETRCGPRPLWRGEELLIVPYGIETPIAKHLCPNLSLLIVPYGIETLGHNFTSWSHPTSNRTLWNWNKRYFEEISAACKSSNRTLWNWNSCMLHKNYLWLASNRTLWNWNCACKVQHVTLRYF